MDAFFIFSADSLYILALIIALVFFLKASFVEKKRWVVFGLIVLPLAYVLSLGAGALYYNPQPWMVENFVPLIDQQADNGFPSHHTLLVAAIAAGVWRYNRRVGGVLWGIALLVGVSRVYVGVHHSIDIFASIMIVLLVSTLGHRLLK